MTESTAGEVPNEGAVTTTKVPVQEPKPSAEDTHKAGASKDTPSSEHKKDEKVREQVVVPAGYWHAFEGKAGVLNVFAALGVIFALPFFPLGLLFSFMGLSNAQKHRFDRAGKVLAIVGIGLSLAAALFAIVHLFVKISVGMLY